MAGKHQLKDEGRRVTYNSIVQINIPKEAKENNNDTEFT